MENDSISELMNRINNKLDLLIELIHAQNDEDWKRVDEVCKKLDLMKKAA